MKKLVVALACGAGFTFLPADLLAQTTLILYGYPATVSGDGTLTCADNSQVCWQGKKIGDPEVSERAAKDAIAPNTATDGLVVTAFTQNGPVSFVAAPTYQATEARGRKVYRFQKLGPIRRVVYSGRSF